MESIFCGWRTRRAEQYKSTRPLKTPKLNCIVPKLLPFSARAATEAFSFFLLQQLSSKHSNRPCRRAIFPASNPVYFSLFSRSLFSIIFRNECLSGSSWAPLCASSQNRHLLLSLGPTSIDNNRQEYLRLCFVHPDTLNCRASKTALYATNNIASRCPCQSCTIL